MARRAPLLEVRVDTSGLEKMGRAFRELSLDAREKAEVRAINHVGNKAFTVMGRTMAKTMGMKVGEAKASMKKRYASAGSPAFRIVAKGSYLTLFRFGGRQTKRGASSAAWGKRRVYAHSFVARMPSGHTGIFKRMPGSEMASRKKEKIKEMWGPAFPVEMVKGDTKLAFERLVDTDLLSRFEHELTREVDRVKAKYGL
jgi:minor tail protein Z (GPZ)